ncbi:MAG: sugar phosphate isomerase/epimerase family protein [Spirochaetales bacterium]
MHLSITSDFFDSHDDPIPYLHAIRSAGFTFVHFCHEWDTDRLYSPEQIREISNELVDLGLSVNNLHASEGVEISWGHSDRLSRNKGVELVKNRMEMAAELGADTIILHADVGHSHDAQRQSLEELLPSAQRIGVRIALENLVGQGFSRAFPLIHEFDSEMLGYCLDTGHAILDTATGFDDLADAESNLSKLYSLHLQDNDGSGDQHRLPFTGKVPWKRIAGLIADSPYTGCLTLEVISENESYADHAAFLEEAFSRGRALDAMVAEASRAR